MNYNIVAIPGDGIGPEIVREAKKTSSELIIPSAFIAADCDL